MLLDSQVQGQANEGQGVQGWSKDRVARGAHTLPCKQESQVSDSETILVIQGCANGRHETLLHRRGQAGSRGTHSKTGPRT